MNLKINTKLMKGILACGVGLAIATTVCTLMHNQSNRVLELEKEIAILSEEKEALQSMPTFEVRDLFVIKNDCILDSNYQMESVPDLSIVYSCVNYLDVFGEEFTDLYDKELYTLYSDRVPLIEYLTEDELALVAAQKGKITQKELKDVIERLRENYDSEMFQQKLTYLYNNQY